uniref:Protein kinase domain-containing protein n=1 Tax=Megaselia scalaris TaxID=36166 RepID=T1GMR5_MEGSC
MHFDPRIVHHKISWIVKAIVICLLLISFILITWIILYRKPHIEKMKKYCGHESFIMSDQIKDPKNFIEFTCHFDDMEIPLENIKIEDEELGAGAFGIVKRCIYKDKECNFRHAAVKMLKYACKQS